MSVVVGGTKREFLRLSIECLLSNYSVQNDIMPCPGGFNNGQESDFPSDESNICADKSKRTICMEGSRKEIAFKESRRQRSPLPPEEGEIRESLNAVGVRWI